MSNHEIIPSFQVSNVIFRTTSSRVGNQRFGEERNKFPCFSEVSERREKGEFEDDDDSKFPPPPPPEEADSILAALSKVMGNNEKIIQIFVGD